MCSVQTAGRMLTVPGADRLDASRMLLAFTASICCNSLLMHDELVQSVGQSEGHCAGYLLLGGLLYVLAAAYYVSLVRLVLRVFGSAAGCAPKTTRSIRLAKPALPNKTNDRVLPPLPRPGGGPITRGMSEAAKKLSAEFRKERRREELQNFEADLERQKHRTRARKVVASLAPRALLLLLLAHLAHYLPSPPSVATLPTPSQLAMTPVAADAAWTSHTASVSAGPDISWAGTLPGGLPCACLCPASVAC